MFYLPRSNQLGFPGAWVVKNPPANAGDADSVPGLEDPLGKEMAIHSSSLAWEIPCTEEPLGYSPWGPKDSDTNEWLNSNKCFRIIVLLCIFKVLAYTPDIILFIFSSSKILNMKKYKLCGGNKCHALNYH